MVVSGKVSIIINNYNYEPYLAEAVDSALDQTYAEIEVIVVDDGSTDGSLELLRQYGDRIRVVSQRNQGQGAALNTGFNEATGDWVLFLDADDTLDPNSVQSLVSVATTLSRKHAAIQFKLRCIDARGNAIIPEQSNPQSFIDSDPLASLLREGSYCFAPTSGNLFRAESLREVMPVPVETYKICADLYIQTAIPFVGKIHFVSEGTLGSYRIHGSNNFVTKEKEERKIILKLQRELSLGSAKRSLIGILSKKHGHSVSAFALKPGQSALLKQLVCKRSIGLLAEEEFDRPILVEMIYNVAKRSRDFRSCMSNIRVCLFGILISFAPRSQVGRLYCRMISV
jgi:glycosyltransferase involved in cell wall biosynthesis